MPDFAFHTTRRTAAGTASWTPASLEGGMALWLDAATVAAQAGDVAVWSDLAGHGRYAVQTNPALRPAWRYDAQCGRGVLRFQGGEMTLPNLGLASDLSAFWVMHPDTRQSSNQYPIYMFLDGSSFDGSGRKPLLHGVEASPEVLVSQIGNIGVNHASAPDTVQIGGIVSRPGRVESALNGATPIVQTHQTAMIASAATGCIGAVTGLCDWCELIVVPRSVTPAERQRVEGYLAHRWACVDLLPATHPHAQTAP